MPRRTEVDPLPWTFGVHEAMRAWDADTPLLALTSGSGGGKHERWSILAPRGTVRSLEANAPGASDTLLRMLRESAHGAEPAIASLAGIRLPFAGGWIGFVGYECGALLEPRAQSQPPDAVPARGRGWPDAVVCDVPRALVYSHDLRQWWEVGDPAAPPVRECVDAQVSSGTDLQPREWSTADGGSLRNALPMAAYLDAVARSIELIRDGDIFQANISQSFVASIEGRSRAFAVEALHEIGPRYGALLELDDDHSIVSFSPESFLALDGATRQVVTRPMKGTRPAGAASSALLASAKDAAELHMIMDLMRNDLGRVCDIGSVRVSSERLVERHPTVLQAVGEVSGRLADSVGLDGLLRATFPPGSVTGAPKVRAMQVIGNLEAETRGPYCGAIGIVSGCGSAQFSVAIRTALLTRAQGARWGIEYRAGCGVVAESDPEDEYAESIAKTKVLSKILEAGEDASASSHVKASRPRGLPARFVPSSTA